MIYLLLIINQTFLYNLIAISYTNKIIVIFLYKGIALDQLELNKKEILFIFNESYSVPGTS